MPAPVTGEPPTLISPPVKLSATLVTVPVPLAVSVPPADSASPVPTVTAVGTAAAVPGLPNSVEAAMVPSEIVPAPVMVPPARPAPAMTLVTVPVPVAVTDSVPAVESVRPEPTASATGTAAAVPGLPNRLAAVIVPSEMVPAVLIVPPARPVPAMIDVTLPPLEVDSSVPPAVRVKPEPTSTDDGAAVAVPGLPSSELALTV